MNTQTISVMAMLNHLGADSVSYLDLTNKKAVLLDCDGGMKPDNLVEMPYREMLCPHQEAVAVYLGKHAIVVPDNTGIMAHLKDIGKNYDFYAFWDEMVAEAFEAWLEGMGLSVAEILQNSADDF